MSAVDTKNPITVTETALKELKRTMQESNIPDAYGLRVGIKAGGCSGFEYSLGFDAESKEGDSVLEDNGIKIFLDPKSLFYLTGTILDYSGGLNGKGFTFENPNASRTCGCGSSFGV